MELYMKQKVFSLKGKFDIYDAEQNPQYSIEGKVISLHKKHYIYNNAGEQVAYVHQKVVSLMPKFFIELNDGHTYEMKGKLAFAHEKCVIEELGWEIRGKFLQHDYTITKGEAEIASIHQKWLSWGDTYEISIAEGTDPVMVLAVMLCFDVMHEESAAASSAAASSSSSN